MFKPSVITRSAFLIGLAVGVSTALGCAKAPVSSTTPVEKANANSGDDLNSALRDAEKGDFDRALKTCEALNEKEPSMTVRMCIAHARFGQKNFSAVRENYKELLMEKAISTFDAQAIGAEVSRLETDIENAGKSTYFQHWFRAERMRQKAVQEFLSERYEEAAKKYGDAFEVLANPEFLFSAAIAATYAENWAMALFYYKACEARAPFFSNDLLYRITAEIDRLEVILTGKEPVTQMSLAEEIIAERATGESVEELPPSMRQEKQKERETGNLQSEPTSPSSENMDAEDVVPAVNPYVIQENAEVSLSSEELAIVQRHAEVERIRAQLSMMRVANEEMALAIRMEHEDAAATDDKEKVELEKALREGALEEKRLKTQLEKIEKKEHDDLLLAQRRAAAKAKKADREKAAAERAIARKVAVEEKKKRAQEKRDAQDKQAVEKLEKKRAAREAADANRTAVVAPPKVPAPQVIRVSVEDLIFYSRSKSSAVRFKAVHDLISLRDDRARLVLEERMFSDRNLQVRLAAIEGLARRQSVASVDMLKRAVTTAGTSQERAALRAAITSIMEHQTTRQGE